MKCNNNHHQPPISYSTVLLVDPPRHYTQSFIAVDHITVHRTHNALTVFPDVSCCVHLAELRLGFNVIARAPDTIAANGACA